MLQNLQNVAKFQKFQLDNLVDFEKMLKNASFLAKIGADTAEIYRNLPKFCRSTVSLATGLKSLERGERKQGLKLAADASAKPRKPCCRRSLFARPSVPTDRSCVFYIGWLHA